MQSAGLLFDPGARIDIYRGRAMMRARFQNVVEGTLIAYLSVISEAELWRGIKPVEIERHEAILAYFNSLTVDSRTARLAGEWMQKYESQGLGRMDALIVAAAKKSGLPVITRDAKLAHVLGKEARFQVYTMI